jgi:hypothetical protein
MGYPHSICESKTEQDDNLIKSLWDTVSQSLLINIYLAKFEFVLKYGIIFWGGMQKDSETLFKLHNKCVRMVKGVKMEFPLEICFVN